MQNWNRRAHQREMSPQHTWSHLVQQVTSNPGEALLKSSKFALVQWGSETCCLGIESDGGKIQCHVLFVQFCRPLCQLVEDFADHAGQSWRQTLLDKSRCVLFSVLSRQNISHWSFDGAARIGYLRQGMNWGASDALKLTALQLIALQSGFIKAKKKNRQNIGKGTTEALSRLTHSTPLAQSRSFNKLWNIGQSLAWFCLGKVEKYI